ncbi:virulence-associated E family protein [Corynebacterium sp. H113]|uniref:virulence-associated E family protein n=1 Tax=Corynebacterium sp. H113 TaxID=3133419 RepID=UPI0030986F0B
MTTTSRELKIAEAPTRLAKTWTNHKTTWQALTARLQDAVISPNTVEQYQALPKGKQADAKDVGGFVGGHLADGRRKNGHILARSIITLDVDFPPEDFLTNLDDYTMGIGGCLYSTHSHAPGHERYRLVLPLTRDVTAEEYEAVARKVAADIGIDIFDDTTYEPHRLMYWPSRPIDAEFVYRDLDTTWINPDDVLAEYDNWRDVTTWPVSSRQKERLQHAADSQADPLTKPGLVGAFCRAHDIHHTIDTFLTDVYQPTTGGRYTYTRGESTNGVVTYDDKFAFSHHGTDPAGGQLTNAFDLVRIHKFGTEDTDAKPGTPTSKLPSFKRMVELAKNDTATNKQLADELRQQVIADFTTEHGDAPDTTWMERIARKNNGAIEESLGNLALILTHDPGLQEIRYNQLSETIDVRNPSKLPWKQTRAGWGETDIAQLKLYLENRYQLYSSTKTMEALDIAAGTRAYHPIRDYLNSLPAWDGVERIDTLLVDYLGAPDTAYTRAVTRKTLVAAVRRIYRPGTKFDTVLILSGPQGTGKSTLFSRLAGDWFSDALSLTDMKDKTGSEKLQGYWIHELGELAGMRKMEVEVVKGFISRTDDKYRAAYARTVESHPRQCIIVGSTNAENGFLRDVTGNRRFWPVAITGESEHKTWNITHETVAQIWAEALAAHRAGEPLHLSGELAVEATRAQDAAIETDERVGVVQEYLDTDLPAGWESMSVQQRRGFLAGHAPTTEFGGTPEPLTRRMEVSNAEIWSECFGNEPGDMQPKDSYAISAIMKKLDGWEKPQKRGGSKRVFPYGKQRIYRRKVEQPPF